MLVIFYFYMKNMDKAHTKKLTGCWTFNITTWSYFQKYVSLFRAYNIDGKIFCPMRNRRNFYFQKFTTFMEKNSSVSHCQNKAEQDYMLTKIPEKPFNNNLSHYFKASKAKTRIFTFRFVPCVTGQVALCYSLIIYILHKRPFHYFVRVQR